MATQRISGERFTLTTRRSFADVVGAIDRGIAHPNIPELFARMKAAPTPEALRRVVDEAVGPAGLMEFLRFDFGLVLRKDDPPTNRSAVRIVIGNPMVMRELVRGTPDAGMNAPVSVLVDERGGEVALSYDRMAPFMGAGDAHGTKVARDLDAKIERLLADAAGAPP
jgi:uncharacterized protein (DUF302 family)